MSHSILPIPNPSTNRSHKENSMFAFLKKHAVAITVSTAVLVAAALGFTWARPGTVSAFIGRIGSGFQSLGASIASLFNRVPTPVDVAAAAMGPEAAANVAPAAATV